MRAAIGADACGVDARRLRHPAARRSAGRHRHANVAAGPGARLCRALLALRHDGDGGLYRPIRSQQPALPRCRTPRDGASGRERHRCGLPQDRARLDRLFARARLGMPVRRLWQPGLSAARRRLPSGGWTRIPCLAALARRQLPRGGDRVPRQRQERRRRLGLEFPLAQPAGAEIRSIRPGADAYHADRATHQTERLQRPRHAIRLHRPFARRRAGAAGGLCR